MSVDPLSFDFKLAESDLSLFPADADLLIGNESMMRLTLEKYLHEMFERLPGKCSIGHHENHISVTWLPGSSQDMDLLMDLVISLIRRRAIGQAETILRTLLTRDPVDRRVLLNLGSMLCEQGRVPEARKVLKRLTRTAPDFADGWNALGVALSREGRGKEAASAFCKSLALEPDNGCTLRNLGTLMARKNPQEALPYLKRAAKLLSSDQSALYAYAKGLMGAGRAADADGAFKKAIALNERSEIADLCREARIDIVRRRLKTEIPRGMNREVVAFCMSALETFRKVGCERTQAIVFELASIANSGLNIRDRTSRLRLLSLPGEFSPLQLVVYMYVGLKKTAPRADPGIDFSREYAFALARLPAKNKKRRF